MSFDNQLQYLNSTIQGLDPKTKQTVQYYFVQFAKNVVSQNEIFKSFLEFEDILDSLRLSADIKDKIKTHVFNLLDGTITNLELAVWSK